MTMAGAVHKTVVIADDTPFVRERFKAAIEHGGHRAYTVKSAAELLARVRADLPDIPPLLTDATSVFNPGAVMAGGITYLMLRVQARSRETFMVMAESADGVRFAVRPEIVDLRGIEAVRERIYHVYDARITALEGAHYLMFAMDMDGGCQLGLARTDDLRAFRFMGITSTDDVRNGVLFPDKFVGGLYLRLERPNKAKLEGGPTTGSEIWLAGSDDLLAWRRLGPVMGGRFHYWDEWPCFSMITTVFTANSR